LEISATVGNLGHRWKSRPKLDEIINYYNKHLRFDNFMGISKNQDALTRFKIFAKVGNLGHCWKSWPLLEILAIVGNLGQSWKSQPLLEI
jgi:hypothetical protein